MPRATVRPRPRIARFAPTASREAASPQFPETTAAASLAGLATHVGLRPCALGAEASPTPIEMENRREGSLDWQLTRVKADRRGGVRASAIEGNASRQSVSVGDKLDLFASTSPATRFIVEVFRTGYYGGLGARLVTTLGPLVDAAQPVPPAGPNGIVECEWKSAATLVIHRDWVSGVFLARLTMVPEVGQPYWQN